jgi:hypothetical protein
MSSLDEREHNVLVAIFSVSAAMVGVCLTGIGLLQVVGSVRPLSTLADELLAVDAVLFLSCCLVAFLSFRTQRTATKLRLRQVADGLFFFGLLLMVVVCGLITTVFLR